MNVQTPRFYDPCKNAGAIPEITVYCDHCGMLGVGDNWQTVHISVRVGYRKRCPNCQETNVRSLQEGLVV